MTRSIRLGGHPIHPLLVHFPIALWTLAVGADIAGWMTGQPIWWLMSFGAQALGVLMATLAMLAGFLDYAAIPRQHPAQDTVMWHMLLMSTAWLLFLISLALRGSPGTSPPSAWASSAAMAGFMVMVSGGWLGGQLVYRFGVGVKDASVKTDRDSTQSG